MFSRNRNIIKRLRVLHQHDSYYDWCKSCYEDWPCATAVVLNDGPTAPDSPSDTQPNPNK